jgi:methylenetetrahydrofolate dehydrogenase (NADP+)/methenyltetrahydrofolate cyclohydrolase
MSIIIDGHAIAQKIKDEIAQEIAGTVTVKDDLLTCQRPNLAIVLVGEREDSRLYTKLKEKEASTVGVDTHIYKCLEEISEEDLLEMINFLNKDDLIDAILVQLPLPDRFNTDKIISAMNPQKDVDRFHPDNIKLIAENPCAVKFLPPVFAVVVEILRVIKESIEQKQVCIVSNSDIFGKNLAKVLACQKCQVTVIHPDEENLAQKTAVADILITAVGKPGLIKKEMIKTDAIIIDIGITKRAGHVVGDVDFTDIKDKCAYITPVPGGVGPITIAMTLKNTLTLFQQKNKK